MGRGVKARIDTEGCCPLIGRFHRARTRRSRERASIAGYCLALSRRLACIGRTPRGELPRPERTVAGCRRLRRKAQLIQRAKSGAQTSFEYKVARERCSESASVYYLPRGFRHRRMPILRTQTLLPARLDPRSREPGVFDSDALPAFRA